MSWARLDDHVSFHAKTLAAGNEAFGAWIRMLAHACAHLTDGHVERHVAATICPQNVIDRLVAVGFLDVVGEDYQIHSYLEWNPSAVEVKSKRNQDNARKSTGRNRQGRSPGGRLTSARNPDGILTESERNPSGIRAESARASTGPLPSHPIPSPSGGESARARDPAPGGVERVSDPESETRLVARSVASLPVKPPRIGPTLSPEVEGAMRVVRLTDEITPELEATAKGASQGPIVQNVPDAWTAFKGKYAGQVIHVAGSWTKWCVSWAGNERKDRERERDRKVAFATRPGAKQLQDLGADATTRYFKIGLPDDPEERALCLGLVDAPPRAANGPPRAVVISPATHPRPRPEEAPGGAQGGAVVIRSDATKRVGAR